MPLLLLLLLLTTACAGSAEAQTVEPVKLDLKPAAALALGSIFDVATTKHCLASNPLAYESNTRYTHAPFTPHQPNYGRMWRDKALLVGAYTAIALSHKWLSNRQSMQTAERRDVATGARQLHHLYGYVAGGAFGYIGARNLSRCF